ncbi:chlorophyll synthase, chloroplastic [Olea europaea subsp. europaea]|uniref:Chlorophyll synthase, chloroplastic n=1 Tax=Olea europaea subsp. europaea TaxID=158383 RepID=A0A8S0S3R1_OLEEU|nr:chlorophyll synthase, chloroplastic [Olea europaea subsp. europaea]
MAFTALNTVYSIRLSYKTKIINPPRNPQFASTPITLSFNRRTLIVRATESDTNEDEATAGSGSSIIQILGIKGAKQETDKWKIRIQLMKPVTWPPLVWGVVCGAAASGNFHWSLEDIAKSVVCMIMSGPCLTGYTQTLNDWYDREIDAINEPYRPIPSGAISKNEVIMQIWVLLLGGLGLAEQRLKYSSAGFLLGAGKPYHSLALLGMVVPQVFFQFKYFLRDPVKYDVKYQASAQPFLILGLLISAIATSHSSSSS